MTCTAIGSTLPGSKCAWLQASVRGANSTESSHASGTNQGQQWVRGFCYSQTRKRTRRVQQSDGAGRTVNWEVQLTEENPLSEAWDKVDA